MTWQPGDLALCIDARPAAIPYSPELEWGRIYTVQHYRKSGERLYSILAVAPLIVLEEFGPIAVWRASRFRKIPPRVEHPDIFTEIKEPAHAH